MTVARRLCALLVLAALLIPLAHAEVGRFVTKPYEGSVPQGAWDAQVHCGLEPGVVCFEVLRDESLATLEVHDASGLPAVYYVAHRPVGQSEWEIWPSPFCPGSVHNVREGEFAVGVATWVGWGCDGLPAAYTGTVGEVVVRFT